MIIKLLKNRLQLVAVALLTYAVYAAILLLAVWPPSLGIIWYLSAPLVLYEIVLRLLLRLGFGREYRYWLFSYFFIDHPIYGYAFRPKAKSREIPFLIFDKFAFREGKNEIYDLAANRTQRVDLGINSRGFRGREFAQKNPGVVRIFTCGDSVTACAFVDDDQTWPAALERELAVHGVQAEVINASVGAWTSYQQYLQFEKELIGLEPDIVLLNQGWNEEFWFSAQNLGKSWRPYQVLNSVELKNLYAHVGPVLSSTGSLFFHLIVASYFHDLRFKRSMDFSNPKRWACLEASSYLEHWFDNLTNFAKLGLQKGIKLYAINTLSLFDFEDSIADRELYVNHAKIAPIAGDYLASSKQRIGHVLELTNSIIPCLDAQVQSQQIRGEERARLFFDKFHYTPAGNQLLAKIIARQLVDDSKFSQKGSNVNYNEHETRGIRQIVGRNEPKLARFISAKKSELERK